MNRLLSFAINTINEMKEMSEERENQIRAEWRNSMRLPRKKKKQVRKRLILDWNINEWSKSMFQWNPNY